MEGGALFSPCSHLMMQSSSLEVFQLLMKSQDKPSRNYLSFPNLSAQNKYRTTMGYSENRRCRKQSIKPVTTNISPQFLFFPLPAHATEDSKHLSLSLSPHFTFSFSSTRTLHFANFFFSETTQFSAINGPLLQASIPFSPLPHLPC